jgi:transcriptional regulator with XRE-family HTH domain
MRAGVCDSCGGWLGSATEISVAEDAEPNAELNDRIKIANMIGEMLAAAPSFKREFFKEHLATSIRKFTNQFPPLGIAIFESLIEVNREAVSSLMHGKNRVRLGVLVRICRAFEISVAGFLDGKNVEVSSLLEQVQSIYLQKKNEIIAAKINKKNEILERMKTALNSCDCPSVRELTRQLGFKSRKSLWLVSAELCRKIAARNKEHSLCKKVAARNKEPASKMGPKYPCYTERVRIALIDAMKEEPAPTVKDVSLRAGYKNEVRFREKYPRETKFLMERRREYRRAEYSKLEKALLKALDEEPPPSLKDVCGRLTYKDKPFKWVQSLVCKFPSLCRAISARYKTYKITKVRTGSIRGKAQC